MCPLRIQSGVGLPNGRSSPMRTLSLSEIAVRNSTKYISAGQPTPARAREL